MGEAKEKEKAGQEPGLFSESDKCPACGKTCADMQKEHGNKLITLSGGAFIVCWRCGNIFFPQSRLKYFAEAAERVIVDPNSPVGQATQAAAQKIVLPGGK